ncbi:MAG: 50S ribosomal protein L18 [Thaumarchaeota archaeon]|nr:50S ribosomal protein L18 [Nitrososphaerota archaeon]
MPKARFVAMLRRRRDGKTDYNTRKKVILSKENFIAIRISGRNTNVQVSEAKIGGDNVIAAAHSRELKKLGWKSSGKSIPAAYLTGLLAGQKAKNVGVESAIVYSGIRPFRAASRIAAAVKGVIDAGIAIPVDEEVLPSEERIKGEHIAAYASSRKGSESPQFSTWKKAQLSTEKFGDHFEQIESKIKGGK